MYHEVAHLVVSRTGMNLALPNRDWDNHITVVVISVCHAFNKVKKP